MTAPSIDIRQVADVLRLDRTYGRVTMPDRVTIDVIDRPAGGVRNGFRAIRALRRTGVSGMRALFALGTGGFVPSGLPAPTPRRIAVLAAWEGEEDVDARWGAVLEGLAADAREHWHVEAEVVRAAFSARWKGWKPETEGARPLDGAEPALVLISGDLRARYAPAFYWNGVGAVRHAARQPGYLGGLFVTSSPLNTTSCSCWRAYDDAREYAYKPGGHQVAMRRDRTRRHHKREYFMRLRPLAEHGSLAGATPLAPFLVRCRV